MEMIGFVGLGRMGRPMSSNLCRKGFRLVVHDINRDAVAELELLQARGAESVAAVARESGIIVTMLPNSAIVDQVVAGLDGVLAHAKPGSLVMDMSTVDPLTTDALARKAAEKGIAFVDAPVGRLASHADRGESLFMVGAAPEDFARVRPLLEAMGKAIFHVGGLGAGHAMKCLNNLITSVNLLALSEGLAMGKRYGLDPEAMVDVLNVSTGMSWVGQTHIKQRVISRRFDDPFKLALMVKDIGIAMALARATATPAPLSALTQQLWRAAAAEARPDASVSELVRWVERTSGTEITAGSTPRVAA
jgi:3-hydroxyisobutyrate dehydrogenase-like beta-hydroxyacid dehydrogenase